MMKALILAGAAMIAAPAMAQDMPGQDQTMAPPAPGQSNPVPGRQTPPTTITPDATQQVDPLTAPPVADQAKPDAAPDAAAPAQVAGIVDQEFPTYDIDKSSDLNETEFTTWMVALRKASDPTFDAAAPATKTWMDQAFASADTDRSKAVSKAELIGFLSKASS